MKDIMINGYKISKDKAFGFFWLIDENGYCATYPTKKEAIKAAECDCLYED